MSLLFLTVSCGGYLISIAYCTFLIYCCATADILMKLLQQCFLFFIVVVIPGHNLGNSQVRVNRTIGPTLVVLKFSRSLYFGNHLSESIHTWTIGT